MDYRIKDIIIIKRLGLLILFLLLLILAFSSMYRNWQFYTFLGLFAIGFIFNFTLLLKLKNLRVLTDRLEITYIFRFKTISHSFNDLQSATHRITKDNRMELSVVDFPYFIIEVKTKDQKSYIFKSTETKDLYTAFYIIDNVIKDRNPKLK